MGMARLLILAAAVVSTLAPVDATAQVFGTFTWQMQPYCNRIALTLSVVPTGFRLDGADDGCGAATRSSAAGVAVFNPNGSVGLNFVLVTPGAAGVHVAAVVSPATGQGTWSDSAGNSGALVFGGAVPGLPPRPTPSGALPVVDVADNPNLPSDPCAPGPAQATLVLCGTGSLAWRNDGGGLPGLQVWRDPLGQVHVRGTVRLDVGLPTTNQPVFILPPGLRPRRTLVLPVATRDRVAGQTAGTAVVLVFPYDDPNVPGQVQMISANRNHEIADFGELVFSVDR